MEILVILLLILLNGLFAMSEIALISARRSNLEMQARQGSAGARQALKLAKDPDRFLSTVQIGITLIGILTGIYSGDTLAAKFGGELARLGIPLRTATVTAQVTIVIAVTYLTIIFGELVPKRIGMNAAERAAKIVARPMRLLSVAASPFVWLLSRSTAGVARWACNGPRARSPRRKSVRSSRKAPRTARCRRSNSRSWAASSRWATAPWSRS